MTTVMVVETYLPRHAAMKAKFAFPAAVLVMLTLVGSARSEDLRVVMEADNARWLAVYNTNTLRSFSGHVHGRRGRVAAWIAAP